MSERKRRADAYRAAGEAVLAYSTGDDADLYNLLDRATTDDALGIAYRLTALAADAVDDLASATGQQASDILAGLVERRSGQGSGRAFATQADPASDDEQSPDD